MSVNRTMRDALQSALADAAELRELIHREVAGERADTLQAAASKVVDGIDRALRVVETERA